MTVSSKSYKRPKIEYLNIFGENFNVEHSVTNLGFILDNSLTMNKQINRVCSLGYMNLRNLWKISRRVTDRDLRTQLVHSCILSRVDYCNSLYYGVMIK